MGGRRLFGHNGGDYGSTTELFIDREAGVGIAVLLNVEVKTWPALIALEKKLFDLAETAR